MKPILAAALIALGCSGAASAQEVIGTYYAEIGQQDLFNSNGARLTEPWQVLRQDRANFHRFGIRQANDEWEPFFANADNRAAMERMLMRGSITPEARRAIMAGGAQVHVFIFGHGDVAEYMEVDVYR